MEYALFPCEKNEYPTRLKTTLMPYTAKQYVQGLVIVVAEGMPVVVVFISDTCMNCGA